MKAVGSHQEVLRRVQQKAEQYREQEQQKEQLQTEIEAIQEVYGISNEEMQHILREVETDLEKEAETPLLSETFSETERSMALTISIICLLSVGITLLFFVPLIGMLFLGGVFAARLYDS